jgi:hypothetical protein
MPLGRSSEDGGTVQYEAGRKVPRRRFGDSSIDIDLNYLNIQLLSYLNYPQLPITINIANSFFSDLLKFPRTTIAITTIDPNDISQTNQLSELLSDHLFK